MDRTLVDTTNTEPHASAEVVQLLPRLYSLGINVTFAIEGEVPGIHTAIVPCKYDTCYQHDQENDVQVYVPEIVDSTVSSHK